MRSDDANQSGDFLKVTGRALRVTEEIIDAIEKLKPGAFSPAYVKEAI
ncbi:MULTISPECIES: hypothetical protein [unclassified Sphingomonas]|nr:MULTISPECIES: hypothetical protein [unclassified Sphingomonas]